MIKAIIHKMARQGLDCVLLSCASNISYLLGFNSRDALLLLSPKKKFYITDPRYSEEAKKKVKKDIDIKIVDYSIFDSVARLCADLKSRRVGFEERYLNFAQYSKLKTSLKGKAALVPLSRFTEEFRAVKGPGELANIKKAADIAASAFKFIKKNISCKKTESEIASELEFFSKRKGASGPAFNTIVAFGTNSVFPHHLTGQRKLRDKGPVLIDFGVEYKGYKSDLTRVFFLGKITSEFKRIYDVVCRAQDRAIKEIKPGVFINKIDEVARRYIAQQGYGGFFTHNLGHGIGIDVHEEPNIGPRTKERLKPGMVFTIEPAIYLPGRFGVRIEDMVLVTDRGAEIISGNLDK
ncbi:MAG: aminopeptidase P family protein [Candidatus Omnitrophica bacterium]|nr:aminopeptidase P family protein [Candidatus Omnitrophota bacterium]